MSPSEGELVTEALDDEQRRLVTVYVPPDPTRAIVYAADGGWHVAGLSDALENARVRSTMIVGVHGRNDDDERLQEYVPGFDAERFAAHERFFVGDVRRWVASQLGVAVAAERTAVWGASLGGEFALAMAIRRPHLYRVALVASPGAGYRPPAVMPATLPSCYLVAGTREQFFLDNAARWASALRDAEADVVMHERDAAHGDAFWTEEFPLMTAWAFDR